MSDPVDPSVDSNTDPLFEISLAEGVCRLGRPDTRFLSTGFDGGHRIADAAYNLTVPEGFDDHDLRTYVADRIDRAGFDPVDVGSRSDSASAHPASAPALLTGVDQTHARYAQFGPVAVVATAGISNPAALPVADRDREASVRSARRSPSGTDVRHHHGTVNVIAGTTRALEPGALANLLAVVAEAKAATLLTLTGFPGTTSDAIVVGDDPAGEPATFSGSATPVGRATRVCVRDAIVASLRSRYTDEAKSLPEDVADAEYGVVTDERATVTRVDRDGFF